VDQLVVHIGIGIRKI